MTKSTITRERLLQLADDNTICKVSWDERIELARMALAAMESEPVRNPVLSYADSYRDMAKQGVESVPIWSVITDLERNIAPLYRHAQQPVVDADDNFYSWFGREWQENYQHNQYTTAAKQMLGVMAESAWKAGRRAAMLSAAPQSPGSDPATVPGKWIPVSERMPEDRISVILWDAEIGEVTSGHYSHKTQTFYHCGDAIENEITHWMPPPCAPQEVNRE